MFRAGVLTFLLMIPRQVLEYGQSQYIRQFGMTIDDDELMDIDARVIKPPGLRYNPESKQPNVVLVRSSSQFMME
jgi:Argonaute linker 2 domain